VNEPGASTLREVLFVGQAWAEAMVPDAGQALISITDTGAPPAALRSGWPALLRVAFDDLDPDSTPVDEFHAGLQPLSPAQAAQIARFVRAAAASATTLVVHCRFGQSRSPAVALAVCRYYGLAFPPGFDTHNRYVLRCVAEALTRPGLA
jgi:predicted protein tyrosine phosphatase